MTSTGPYGWAPQAPAPGAAAPELRVARIRRRATWLVWPALVLIATAGATGYFTGRLEAPLEDWMLWIAASVVVLVLVVLPLLAWLATSYTITTRRVIERSGGWGRRRREFSHTRGYTIAERRGPFQRLTGSGTLTLTNGVDEPLRLRNVGSVTLVREVLADQVEVSQILAHRDAQTHPTP